MITHLAMMSHPNPKSVLVIGGGDGGVLREVIKHSTVESAVLCDIDEAVIRLSEKYLPGMAISYQNKKVSKHIGDGFKFLSDKKNEFDVIITDSSDPEGPAEVLFQKPYFELLHGALKEGGVVTTQGKPFPPRTFQPRKLTLSYQPKANGCTSKAPTPPTSPLSNLKPRANKSSPPSNTPTPPSRPIQAARSASWSAAKTRIGM